MNSKDKDYFDAKLDPMHESVRRIEDAVIKLSERTSKIEQRTASTGWHDWAIKGGIVGIVGLTMEAIMRAIHKG